MKIHDLDPEIIMKVNVNFCNACSRKLEKYLMAINGVYTVVVDPKKRLVTVRGKVDPMMLLKAIAKRGYSAELLSYQKEPKIEDNEQWSENEEEYVGRRTGREKRRHGCPKKHHNPKMEEYNHEVEDYIPPEIDRDICRDPFCKSHRRRPIITNSVPPWDSADHPHHTHGLLCHHGNPFACRRQPASYGLHLGRPVHGFDHFTYFGDGHARGCTIM